MSGCQGLSPRIATPALPGWHGAYLCQTMSRGWHTMLYHSAIKLMQGNCHPQLLSHHNMPATWQPLHGLLNR